MDYYKLPDSPQKQHIAAYLQKRIGECHQTACLYSGVETSENILKREKAESMKEAYTEILRMIQ